MTQKLFREVIVTSLPAIIIVNIIFSIVYFSSAALFSYLYNILSLSSTNMVEVNMSIFSPLNIFITIIASLFIAYTILIGIFSVVKIIVYDYYRNDSIPIILIIKESVMKVRRVVTFKNFPLIFLFFILPGVGITPQKLFTFNVPDYIIDELSKNTLYSFGFGAWLVLIVCLVFLFSFLIPSMVINEYGFIRSALESIKIVKEIRSLRLLKIYFRTLLWIIISLIPIYLFLISSRLLIEIIFPEFITFILNNAINWMISFISNTLPNALLLASLTLSYLNIKSYKIEDIKEKNKILEEKAYYSILYKNLKIFFSRKLNILLVIVLAFVFNYTFPIFANIEIRSWKDVVVIAHRGDQNSIQNIAENTIPAFENAHKKGADIIETDLYENKDGGVIVIHDYNLKRVTGQNIKVADVTSEMLKNIKLKNGENIPTLEEILIWAKTNNVKMLLEPKLHKNEINFYSTVSNLIQKYNMTNQIMIHSLNLDTLVEMKKLLPNVKTGLTIFGGFGDFGYIDTDFYSIQETAITKQQVDAVHKLDKKVYVWTINNADNVLKYVDMGVDGIITDDVEGIKSELTKIEKERIKHPKTVLKVFNLEFDISNLD